ncbi:MAG: TipJ family phage tail tip protein [Microcoleus sp.]
MGFKKPQSNQSEVEDTLRGEQVARAIIAWGEGLLEGPATADAAQSIRLDGVPLRIPGDKTPSFRKVVHKHRYGGYNQQGIPGWTDSIGAEVSADAQVTNRNGAVIRTVTNAETDTIVLNFNVRLFKSEKGDIKPNELIYRISTKRGTEAWKIRGTYTIKGIAQNPAPTSEEIPVDNLGGTANTWQVRVEKLSKDGERDRPNELYWQTLVPRVEEKLGFNRTAISCIQVSSDIFTSFPGITNDLLGARDVRYPAGATIRADRTLDLTGVSWTGALTSSTVALNSFFATVVDFLTNPTLCDRPRTLAEINLTDLFKIEKWNSTLISTPLGMRPRWALAFYLDEDDITSYAELKEICSSCFVEMYEADNQIRFYQQQDNEAAVLELTNADCKQGSGFTYGWTEGSTRYNQCRATYYNADFHEYRISLPYEEVSDLAIRPRNTIEVEAIGTYGEEQANRYSKATIKMAQLNTQYFSAVVHPRACFVRPGQVVKIYDEAVANVRNGGLLRAWNGTTTFTVDALPVVSAGDKFNVHVADGTYQELTIASSNTGALTITTTAAPTQTPIVGSVWTCDRAAVQPQRFLIRSVRPTEDEFVEISGTNYIQNFWAVVEQDAAPLLPNVVGVAPIIAPPLNIRGYLLEVEAGGYDTDPRLFTVWGGWDENPNVQVSSYICEFASADGQWTERQKLPKEAFEVRWTGKVYGKYQVRVAIEDTFGRVSDWAYSEEITSAVTGVATQNMSLILKVNTRNTDVLSLNMRNLSATVNIPNVMIAFKPLSSTAWEPSGATTTTITVAAAYPLDGSSLQTFNHMARTFAGINVYEPLTSKNYHNIVRWLFGGRTNKTFPLNLSTSSPNSQFLKLNTSKFEEIAIFASTGTAGTSAAIKVVACGQNIGDEFL